MVTWYVRKLAWVFSSQREIRWPWNIFPTLRKFRDMDGILQGRSSIVFFLDTWPLTSSATHSWNLKATVTGWKTHTNLDISSQDTVSSVCWVPRIFLHTLAADWCRFAVESWFHSHKSLNSLTRLPNLTSDHSLKRKRRHPVRLLLPHFGILSVLKGNMDHQENCCHKLRKINRINFVRGVAVMLFHANYLLRQQIIVHSATNCLVSSTRVLSLFFRWCHQSLCLRRYLTAYLVCKAPVEPEGDSDWITQTWTSLLKTRFHLFAGSHAFSSIHWRGIGTGSQSSLGSIPTSLGALCPSWPAWPAAIHWK